MYEGILFGMGEEGRGLGWVREEVRGWEIGSRKWGMGKG
jgi:hypothetical protein